jgi:uncharacterized protein YcnI
MTIRENQLRQLKSIAILLATTLLPVLAHSHAIVFPQESGVSSWEKYVLRVPNERNVATINVELTFPQSIRVMSFADVPGWKLTVHVDSSGAPVAAEWTGKLEVGRFVEFPFVAVNPDTGCVISWPTTQEYAGGELVHWTGAEGTESPASVTSIVEPEIETTDSVIVAEPEKDTDVTKENVILWGSFGIAIVALLVAILRK